MNSLALNVGPEEFLAGWRSETGRLFLPAFTDSRVHDDVAVRIGLIGQPVRATVYGRVSMVRRFGRPSLPPGAEIHLDPASVPAASYLAAVAGGARLDFEMRAPRFATDRHLVAEREGVRTRVRTLNVSEGGCCIAWTGPHGPAAGDRLRLRVAGGWIGPSVDGVVCWVSDRDPERTAGVRLVPEGWRARAWRSLVDETARGRPRTV